MFLQFMVAPYYYICTSLMCAYDKANNCYIRTARYPVPMETLSSEVFQEKSNTPVQQQLKHAKKISVF